jgi:hypothetical protein
MAIRLQGGCHGCGAGGYAEFFKDVFKVFVNGSRASGED